MGIADSNASSLSAASSLRSGLATPGGTPVPAAKQAALKGPVDTLKLQAAGGEGAGTLGWVRTQGDRLVDAQGREVPVRGVNLGGWLVQEPWMMPLAPAGKDAPPVKDQAALWGELEKRFGTAKMSQIRDAYRSAWMSEDDFARIKAAGFTTVRLPFTYAQLQEPDGYKWLDWAIDNAAKHGLYTILDLHGAPGGQSDAMHTGEAGQNRFFKDPANVEKAAQMWRQVAQRYAGRPEVLGFDLLNEPMGAADTRELYQAQNKLYQAIRQVDPQHVIFFEDGYKGVETFPDPAKQGWKNVGFSIHQYDFNAKSGDDHLKALQGELERMQLVREKAHVPVYMGEFSVPGAHSDTLGKFVDTLNQADVPWTMWNYKVVFPHADDKNVWGLYRNQEKPPLLDVYHDSPEELLHKIDALRTENLQAVPGEVAMFQKMPATNGKGAVHVGLKARLTSVAVPLWSGLGAWWDKLRSLT